MKHAGPRRFRLRTVVTYPVVTVALVVSVALAVTSFGPSQAMALTALAAPTETATPTPSTTPLPTPSTTPAPTPTPSTTPVPAPLPSPSASAVAAPGVVTVDHDVLARIEGPPFQADYLPVDDFVPDAVQFQTIRVRFQVRNASADAISVTPQLEFRTGASASYTVVPEKPMEGIPFQAASEWVPSLGLSGGRMQSPRGEDIAAADLRIGKSDGLAMTGHHSMGANPDQKITLPSASYTEQEFTIKLTMDVHYLTAYELRITNGGTALAGKATAEIRLGAAPAVVLSPGQHQGLAVLGPKPAGAKPGAANATGPAVSSSAGSAFPGALAASSTVSEVPAAPTVSRPSTILYPLVAGNPAAVGPDPLDQIHGPYSITTDKCGICHRTHTAKAPSLLTRGGSLTNPGSQSALCLTCHAGNGADPAANDQYNLAQPPNNATTRAYYSHDAVGATTPEKQHTQSQLDEFGGQSNRHSECTDCHNPHQATASATRDTTMFTDGWAASGRLSGVSGVSVAYVGSTPIYTLLSGVDTNVIPANLVTREYQLCFKCHSGFTTLTSNAGLQAAQPPQYALYALDKGVEFNPNNPSFHPVEAKGTNDSPAMKASLAGDSAYKLWNFKVEQTVRCLNCHASSSTPNLPKDVTPSDTTLPLAGGALAPHTSLNRGILIRNYKDRVLKTRSEAYSEMDFALCYVCHGSAPFALGASFAPSNSNAALQTNFRWHSLHVTDLTNKPSMGTDNETIDTPGAGAGNAICAECHFRLHSTTYKVGDQAIDGTRLVNFAPNVQPYNRTLSWTRNPISGSGSCTLTCHGYPHDGAQYPTTTPTPTPTP